MTRLRLLAGAVLLTVAVAGCTSGNDAAPRATPSFQSEAAAVGQLRLPGLGPCPSAGPTATGRDLLPDITLRCLSAAGPQLVSLRQATGKPLVVNLWASWCGPCREELPTLGKLADAAGDRVQFLGVYTRDTDPDPGPLLASFGVRYPSLVDLDGEVLAGVAVKGLPVTVLVDAQGAVVKVLSGGQSESGLRSVIAESLGVQL